MRIWLLAATVLLIAVAGCVGQGGVLEGPIEARNFSVEYSGSQFGPTPYPQNLYHMRWAVPIKVKLDTKNAAPDDITEFRAAMNAWEDASGGKLKFEEVDDNANINVAWASSPIITVDARYIWRYFGNSSYDNPVSTGEFNLTSHGFMLIVSEHQYMATCKGWNPLYMLGAMLGLSGNNDTSSVMNPTQQATCPSMSQEINDTLASLYAPQMLADLNVKNVSANSDGQYINVSFAVINQGLMASNNFTIALLDSKNNIINQFELNGLEPGYSYNDLWMSIGDLGYKELVLSIDNDNKNTEMDEANNVVHLQANQ
jgi:hypothetical protein